MSDDRKPNIEVIDSKKPHQGVIKHVEKLLARAKSGRLVGFLYFEELTGGEWGTGIVGRLSSEATVFGTAMLAAKAVDSARAAPNVEEEDEET